MWSLLYQAQADVSRKGPARPSAFRLYERDESDGAIVRGSFLTGRAGSTLHPFSRSQEVSSCSVS